MSWIKMNHDLAEKPEVIGIASILHIHEHEVIGHLWKLWTWADGQSLTGNAICVTAASLDRIAKRDGLAEAMRNVGWLEGEDFSLNFPNFERHNGQTAKARALSANRSQAYRATHPSRSRNERRVTRALKERDQIREESTEVRALSEQDDSVTQPVLSGHAPVTEPSRSNHAESVTKALPPDSVQYAEAQLALREVAKVRYGEEIGIWGMIPEYDDCLARALPIPREQFDAFVWWYSLPDDEEIFTNRKHPAWDQRKRTFISLLRDLKGQCQKAFFVQKKYGDSLGDIDPI